VLNHDARSAPERTMVYFNQKSFLSHFVLDIDARKAPGRIEGLNCCFGIKYSNELSIEVKF
jgi:hypothetical protein